MNLHEYQARALLKAAGIPVPAGDVASTPGEVEALARRIGGRVVVKAQVHAGGRGKAGGVKLAGTPAEAAEVASRILGMEIKGLTVHKVLVVPAAEIASEAYVGLILDRESQRPVFMVSPAGGIDIEEVAAKTPDKILRLGVDPRFGLLPHQAMRLAFFLYRDIKQVRAAADIMHRLYQVFTANGASLAEINPGRPPTGPWWRSTPRCRSTTTNWTAVPTWPSCGTRPPRRRARWRHAGRGSPSSSSTATWAAW